MENQNHPQIIESITKWFRTAVPEPNAETLSVQVGCHFEEVAEMIDELRGCGCPADLIGTAVSIFLAAAPAVQGEPVAHLRRDQLQQIKTRGPVVGEISPSPRGDMVAVYAAPQPAEQKPRSDALLVEQTEKIAALLAKAFQGSQLTEGVTFRDCENPKAKQCWDVACRIQEELTATDVENALAELEDDQQPAPDVSALVEALECISKKSHDALKMTDNRAGRAKDEIMCGYAEHIIQMCDAALAAHRKGGDV